MKKLVTFTAALAFACAASAAQAQQVRVIASNPQGSIFYAASVVIGKLMDDKLKMQVRVQPTAGTSTFIPQLDRGEIDFGLTNVDDARTAYKGIEAFKRPNPNLRLTAIAFPLTLGVLVPNDSPIKTHRRPQGQDHALGLQRPDHRSRPPGGRARECRPDHE